MRTTGEKLLRRLLTVNGVVAIVVVVLSLLVPRLITNLSLIRIFTTANIFAMFAASWDILSGYSGQENFGHSAFIGTGGFAVGLLTKYADLPLELSLLVGVAAAALLGLLVGLPSLRLHGPYLALATLGVATALLRLVFVFKERTGGEEGISGIPGLAEGSVTGFIGSKLGKIFVGGYDDLRPFDQDFIVNYFVVLVAAVALITALGVFGASKHGLVLRSIQQDETAAQAAGVNTTRYKLAAFVASSAGAGLAGGLWVHTLSQVGINTLVVDLSLLVIVMAVLGGAGSITGPVAGAYMIIWLQDYLLEKVPAFQEDPDLEVMVYSGLLILVLILRPRGLVAPILRRFANRPLIPPKPDPAMQTSVDG